MTIEQVHIRKTHPNLFRLILSGSVFTILLGINFLYKTPTFNPYGIPKAWIAFVFLTLGIVKLVAVLFTHDLRVVRLTMMIASFWEGLWGLLNLEQGFRGTASFQLPIWCLWVATWQLILLLEPVVNPMTRKSDL